MQIAIADDTGKVSIWCSVDKINKDGSIDFHVINGAWEGTYHDGQVYVKHTNELFSGNLVWTGVAGLKEHSDGKWSCFPESYYNEAIHWIQEQINDPDYVTIQPDQYLENEMVTLHTDEDDIDWNDEVPF
jgi:hypothetical protein